MFSCIKRVDREIDLFSLNPKGMIITYCYAYHGE